jgi:NAD(P)H dehydrogenase (quinone)
MILVTGSTGRVGYRVVEGLDDADAKATAMVRIDVKAADLPPAVQPLVASLDAPPAADVLQKFDRIFLNSPSREQQVELEVTFIDAVVAAGHQPLVVKVAADGFQDPDCQVRFMRSHRQIAKHLEATGLPVVYLAPNVFMETLLPLSDAIRREALIALPAGDGRVAFVASSDVADVAVRVLTAGSVEEGVRVLSGPEALDYADVAARISTVYARQVDYEDVSPSAARRALSDAGLPSWEVEGELELFEWIRAGAADVVTDEVRTATGADPRPLEDWLRELRGAFVGRPSDLPPPRF